MRGSYAGFKLPLLPSQTYLVTIGTTEYREEKEEKIKYINLNALPSHKPALTDIAGKETQPADA
jgi:hypothetical protein